MAFYTILTEIGKAKLANATALGSVVELTEIAVGDGGGVAIAPAETDTALTNEVWRAALNNISIDSANSNWIVAEGYIPSTDGGFTVREVGLFDVDGNMIAIGSYPDTYKPTLDSGSAKDLYIKVVIEVSNADVVELKIDPSVVLSTRKYVDDEVAKRALLGGSATQLFKVKNAVNADEAIAFGQLIGYVFPFATSIAPDGFLECNGTELDTTVYSALYSVIGTNYNNYADWVISTAYLIGDIKKSTTDGLYYEATTDGTSAGDDTDLANGSDTGVSWKIATKFKLPDLRGEFIRGFDNSRGIDSGRAIGSFQLDELKSHDHSVSSPTSSGIFASGTDRLGYYPSTGYTAHPNVNFTGGVETRPRNVAMMFCIKY